MKPLILAVALLGAGIALWWSMGEAPRTVPPGQTSLPTQAPAHTGSAPAPQGTPQTPQQATALQTAALLKRAEPVPAPALLARVAAGGDTPPADRWIWAAVGRVQADPAVAASIGEVVARPHATLRTRELGFDLLAHAGTPAAQMALRDALDAPSVRADERFPAYVQRLSFVRQPDPQLVDWALNTFNEDDPEVQRTLGYALGGLSRNARRSGEDTLASRARAPLETLLASPEPRLRAAGLGGLGNAADPGDIARLISATHDALPDLRYAAVRALRSHHDLAVTRRLAALIDDPAGSVQRAALETLMGRPLTDAQRVQIADRATRPLLTNRALLVNVVADHPAHPETRRALNSVLAQSAGDPHLRARIRSLLAQ